MKKTQPTHTVYSMDSLYDGVVKQAERYGDKERYIYKDKVTKTEAVVTYRDMLDHVNYISSGLTALGFTEPTCVVSGESHPDYAAAYIATVSAGGIIVPLDKDISAEQFAGFIKLCETKVVFYTSSIHHKVVEVKDELPDVKYFICFDYAGDDFPQDEKFMRFADFFEIGKKAYEDGDRTAENHEVDLDKTCAILFTSGTTGTSKGVMLSQRNLVTATLDSCAIMGCAKEDRYVSVLPFHHAYEFTCAQLALPNTGATTVINDSIKNTMRNFAKYQPTALVLVPLYVETMYKRIWAEIAKKGKTKTVRTAIKISNALRKIGIDRRRKLFKDILDAFGGRLQYIVCGGAPLRSELIDDFDAFGIKICEGYGITECSPLVAANPMHWRKHHSCGMRVPHMEVRIDKASPEDETGEIVTRGDAVMKGYYKNPEATAEAFTEDGWFKTGDIGYIDDDDFIFITGRKKNVIILSNGKNIFPEELEEYLGQSEYIAECVVIGRKNEAGETAIWAICYPNYEKFEGATKEEIEAKIREEVDNVNKKLPIFKHIPNVEIRETEFEKTTSRKIMRYKVK